MNVVSSSPPHPITPSPHLPSHTAIALAPLLAAGPHEPRSRYDFAAATEQKKSDLDITQVGREQKMPWEIDGPQWHTQDRVGRTGNPCRWDGKALEHVVERIHELGQFSDTDWNSRSVVEIAAAKKTDGWFFHAITGEEWLLKMKFRTAAGMFQREQLLESIGLTPLNDMHELPIYGTDPRVFVKSQRGGTQEVEIRVFRFDEIDRPEFWDFLRQAAAGFARMTDQKQQNPEDFMPWKVMGERWHLSRKGFPIGRRPKWPGELLEDLIGLLRDVVPEGQFLWNNQQLVHVFMPGQREAWATILTKKPDVLELALRGPTGKVALGSLLHLGRDRNLTTGRDGNDLIRIAFRQRDDLERHDPQHGGLAEFLKAHLERCGASRSAGS